MSRLAKALILFLVFAALPLRGYAGVVMALCESHHGSGAAAAQDSHHGSSDRSGTAASASDGEQDNGVHHTSSICSLCSACSLGATLAPESPHQIGISPAGAFRVPFLHRRVASHTPENPDRPPLVLSL